MNSKENQFTVNTMRVTGPKYKGVQFKLSKVIEALIKRMKDKKLKTNIVHNIHILGCMNVKEETKPDPNLDYSDPFCFSPEVHSKESTPEVSPVVKDLGQ